MPLRITQVSTGQQLNAPKRLQNAPIPLQECIGRELCAPEPLQSAPSRELYAPEPLQSPPIPLQESIGRQLFAPKPLQNAPIPLQVSIGTELIAPITAQEGIGQTHIGADAALVGVGQAGEKPKQFQVRVSTALPDNKSLEKN